MNKKECIDGNIRTLQEIEIKANEETNSKGKGSMGSDKAKVRFT